MRTRTMRMGWVAVGMVLLLCGVGFAQEEPPLMEELLLMDIDGDGEVDALSDGLLALRYLFGFRGDTLIAGALSPRCRRCLPDVIEGYLAFVSGRRLRADPIVGNMWYVPAGTFTQGSPEDEPCRFWTEAQFTHTLTRNLAVMETEVSRRMWADLRAVQPTLPPDPSNTFYGPEMDNPVQQVSWRTAVLFANLLSAEHGWTPAYYVDSLKTQPLTASNYQTDLVFVDWDAYGFRLPTEGEWEYFARTWRTGPFSVREPNYNDDTCRSCEPGVLTKLESVAWFCGNLYDPPGEGLMKPVGSKAPNRWGLKDLHGSVSEWVWDLFVADYPVGARTNYAGPALSATGDRGVRGGFWSYDASYMRSAKRDAYPPGAGQLNIGFRLVRTVQ